jgi:hypothetical protein
MNDHTPTPWKATRFADETVGIHGKIDGTWHEVAVLRGRFAEKHAAFIVAACNSHETLVTALRRTTMQLEAVGKHLRSYNHNCSAEYCENEAEAGRAALAKAGVK